jgi:hypothetical protein
MGVVERSRGGVWVRVGEQLDGDMANGMSVISDNEGGAGIG